jgi:hypothetical protein
VAHAEGPAPHLGAQRLSAARRRSVRALASLVVVGLLAACTPVEAPAEPARAPRPTATAGADDEVARAVDVLGGLAGLLDEDVLACTGDRPLPAARPVDAEDPSDLRTRVEELRALRFDPRPVPLERLDDGAMTALVAERFGGYDEEDAVRELRLLAALGAVPPDADLRRLRVDVFAAQVSGLYQRDDGVASVRMRDPDGPLSPLEQVVAVHELQHAVADQRLGRPADAREGDEDADMRRASLAVVEGDAALTMHLYAATSLDPREREAMRGQLLERAADEPLAEYPPYLRDELRFAYGDGLRLVCARWAAGGWPAVDALYRDPPTTSAQVLWPERYAAGEGAAEVAPPARLSGRWERVRSGAFGAAPLLWLLQSPGVDRAAALPDARARAEAWAGGRVALWADGDRSAVGLALRQRDGHHGLCTTIRRWWAAASQVGPERVGVITCLGDRVGVGIAPDEATARRLARP